MFLLHLTTALYTGFFQPDGVAYSYLALHIDGGQIAFERRAPLLQLMLAFSFKVFGASYWSASLVPHFFGILTTLLILFVARRLYDTRVGLWAMLLATTNLPLMNLSSQILRETLLSALFLLSLYTTLRCRRHARSVLLGIVIGLLYWVREDYLIVAVPLLVYIFVAEKERRGELPLLLSSAAVTASPWAYFSFRYYGTLTPSMQSAQSFTGITYYAPSIELLGSISSGVYYGLHLLVSILSVFAFLFLAIGVISGIDRRRLLLLSMSAVVLLVDSSPVSHHLIWPMPWSFTDASRYLFASGVPLLIFSAQGLTVAGELFARHGTFWSTRKTKSSRPMSRRLAVAILMTCLLLFGQGYIGLLQEQNRYTEMPYNLAGQYMQSQAIHGSVMSFHPELLQRYYSGGEVYPIPSPPSFSNILETARAKRVSYILVDWSMTEISKDVILIYFRSGSAEQRLPPGFNYVAGQAYVWALFEIQSI